MGRPLQFDQAASVTVKFRVTPEQRQSLAVVARENRETVAGVIRAAVDSFVSEYREAHPFVFCGPRRGRVK